MEKNKRLIAFVGLPGSGKSEATAYLHGKGVPFVRFGDVTDKGLQSQGLPLTSEHEQTFREHIRKELGMAAYAIQSTPAIAAALKTSDVVIIDGLYSWAEYMYLKETFPGLIVVAVYAEPEIRYNRLAIRPVRPLTKEKARARDIAEIEKIDKSGPIAIADYLIENNGADVDVLHTKIAHLMERLGIAV